MTTSVTAPLTEAEQVFKDLVWNPMFAAGETWLETEVPFLALPVIKQLDETTIQLIADAMFEQIVEFVDVTAIKLINAANQAAYDSASEQLLIVAQESGVTSDAYQQQKAKALADLSQFTQISH